MPRKCEKCHGSGEILQPVSVKCKECFGTGVSLVKRFGKPCERCEGRGEIEKFKWTACPCEKNCEARHSESWDSELYSAKL
jgi:DnaJ-class molecular chaperone